MSIHKICTVKILIIIFFTSVVVFSQNEIDYEKLKQSYDIISEKDGVLKLQDKLTGRTIVRTENIKSLPADFDPDLTIDLRTIDTTQYSKLFTLWSEVPIGSSSPARIADANNDSRKELYASYVVPPNVYFEYVIYEINKEGSYDSIYNYPDSLGLVRNLGDLENDSNLESVNGYAYYYPSGVNHLIKILTKDSITGYPTTIKTIYDPTTGFGQPVDITLFDMDGDTYPEMIFFLDGEGDSLVLSSSFQITKYDKINNQFSLVWQHKPPWGTRGFAFGDFDSDGKQNFAASNYLGEVFVYEHVEGNNYNVIRIDSLPLSNVYLQLFTNDLDHNGNPELWICGDGYINGIGSQILYIYEAYSSFLLSLFASAILAGEDDPIGTSLHKVNNLEYCVVSIVLKSIVKSK